MNLAYPAGEGGGEERRPRSYSGASFADSSDSSSASLVSHPDVENRERQDKQGSQTAGPPSESAGGAAKEERGDGDRPEANGQEKETKSGAVGDGGAQVGLKVGASDDGGDSEVDVLGVSWLDMFTI